MERVPAELDKESVPWSPSSQDGTTTTSSSIACFESQPLPGESGTAVFIGGSGTTFDWHPSLPGVFLTAAHPKDTPDHTFEQKYDGQGHIQLWKYDDESKTAGCFGLIPHEGHCVWDIQWCPTSSVETSHRFAATFGNGEVAMYQIRALKNLENQAGVSLVDFERCVLRELEERTGLWWVLQWSHDGDRILVGSTQGDVALYDMHEARNEPVILWEAKHMDTAIVSIKWLSKVAYVTTGNDKVARVWDSREPGLVFHETNEHLNWGIVTEALGTSKYIACTHEGEGKLVSLGGITSGDGSSESEENNRVIMNVAGSLRSVVGCSLSAGKSVKGSRITHVCFCGGSSGIVFRVDIPSNVFKVKKVSAMVQKVAQIETDQKSGAFDKPKVVLRLLDGLFEDDVRVHKLRRANNGDSLLFNQPRSVLINKLGLSPDCSTLAVVTGSGLVFLLSLKICSRDVAKRGILRVQAGNDSLDVSDSESQDASLMTSSKKIRRFEKDASQDGGKKSKSKVKKGLLLANTGKSTSLPKKRGRPRKHPAPDSSSPQAEKLPNSKRAQPASNKEGNTIVPKKRGRPRKHPIAETSSQPSDQVPNKRKRGRPRKNTAEKDPAVKNPAPTPHPTSEVNSGSQQKDEQGPEPAENVEGNRPTQKPKKRGGPRKRKR